MSRSSLSVEEQDEIFNKMKNSGEFINPLLKKLGVA